jgi:leucyl aminopeptidase (aminopeptidase T)
VDVDTSRFRWHKTPTPATDGAQKVFTLPDAETYVSGLLEVFVDGLMQTKGVDYNETTSATFTMVNALDANETLRINYIKQ